MLTEALVLHLVGRIVHYLEIVGIENKSAVVIF
ncbi:unnamed protein product, partial [Cuscuta campestris]